MIFSVYDYKTRMYHYYEGAGDAPTTAWFRKPAGNAVKPEVLAAKLPPEAKFLGVGDLPRGVIATKDEGVGSAQVATAAESGSRSYWLGVIGLVVGWFLGKKI